MLRWRTSTWLFVVACAAALVAEVVYATSDDPYGPEPGSALAVLVIVAVVFAFYRAVTRGRS